tara:strand:+ start:418 stop:795 length:378 start_codon:yes stop_codon:yes gene_type:complete
MTTRQDIRKLFPQSKHNPVNSLEELRQRYPVFTNNIDDKLNLFKQEIEWKINSDDLKTHKHFLNKLLVLIKGVGAKDDDLETKKKLLKLYVPRSYLLMQELSYMECKFKRDNKIESLLDKIIISS